MSAGRVGRWLTGVSGVVLIVLAAAHTFGGAEEASDDAGRRLYGEMGGYHHPADPRGPSMMDAYDALSHTMALTFCALGALALLVGVLRETPDRLLRLFGLINAIWIAAFGMLSLTHNLALPATLTAPVGALFLIAALLPRPQIAAA